MLYNRYTGIYSFENNTYPRRIRRRSNLGNTFREKSASYGPGNTVLLHVSMHLRQLQGVLYFYFARVIKLIRLTDPIKSLD